MLTFAVDLIDCLEVLEVREPAGVSVRGKIKLMSSHFTLLSRPCRGVGTMSEGPRRGKREDEGAGCYSAKTRGAKDLSVVAGFKLGPCHQLT